MNQICIKNYSFKYGDEENLALKNINLDLSAGEIVVIFGLSGSGKTTLLKSMKKEIAPVGKRSGEIDFNVSSKDIGIVLGHADIQLAAPKVLNNLTFHMENLGFDNITMKKRLSETVNFFGLSNILHEDVANLSGGEKQLVSLCGAMLTEPKVLLFDEPLSQLDPMLQDAFLEFIKNINQEFNITAVITEHRLENLLPIADRLVFLDKGEKIFDGAKEDVIKKLYESRKCEYTNFIPPLSKASLAIDGRVVFTPKQFSLSYITDRVNVYEEPPGEDKKVIADIKNVVFGYRGGDFVLRRTSFKLYYNDIACLIGSNGSGKTTLLKLLAAILKPSSGKLRLKTKKICYMPQNINSYFIKDTVLEEIGVSEQLDEGYYSYLMERLNLGHLLSRHPFDISEGERQKVCLFSILISKPDLILLDEPTKGMDLGSKIVLKELLEKSGAAVLMSTHDLEFAAFVSGRCLMLFDGDIAYGGSAGSFFGGNRYYTTQINKAVKHIDEKAIYLRDVLKLWEIERQEFLSDY